MMCPPVIIDSVVITKSIALAMSLLLTIILSRLLADRTHSNAVEVQLLPEPDDDPEGHSILDTLIEWRDLSGATLSALFALLFVAADKLTSTCVIVLNAAHVVIFGVVPFMLLTGILLTSKLQLKHVRSSLRYWSLFSVMVIPWYLISLLFVYAP